MEQIKEEITAMALTDAENLKIANEKFLAENPTDEDQIAYYTERAMAVFDEFRIDGQYSYDGAKANVEVWWKNKQEQMKLMRKHPYWNEEAKAIIFARNEKRYIDYGVAARHLDRLIDYVNYTRELSPRKSFNFLWCIRRTIGELADTENECTGLITENFLSYLKHLMDGNSVSLDDVPQHVKSLMRVGVKLTKFVQKMFSECTDNDNNRFDATTLTNRNPNCPDDRTYKSYDKFFAQFADALSELEVKKITVLSLHFCDFLLMSNGNSWASCHYINSNGLFHENDSTSHYHGAYKQGTLSYALDEPSFIFYTLPSSYDGDIFYRQPKLNRMCCQYHHGILITGKCYPNNDDKMITIYRQTMQMIFAGLESVPNRWTFTKRVYRIKAFEQTAEYSAHYHDYEIEDQKPTLSLCKGLPIEMDADEAPMTIGHIAYCLQCGDELDSNDQGHLQCEDHQYRKTCIHCGCCLDEDEGYEINGEWYCDDCTFHCDYHDEREPISNRYGEIQRLDGEWQDVCEYAHDNCLHQCADCEKYGERDEMERIDGEWVCKDCADSYPKCSRCGRHFPKGTEFTDGRCGECTKWAHCTLIIVPCERYERGDYILVKSDLSQNTFGNTNDMLENYVNAIVRVNASNDMGVHCTNGTCTAWSFSIDCFVGKVINADESMLGYKITDFEEVTE